MYCRAALEHYGRQSSPIMLSYRGPIREPLCVTIFCFESGHFWFLKMIICCGTVVGVKKCPERDCAAVIFHLIFFSSTVGGTGHPRNIHREEHRNTSKEVCSFCSPSEMDATFLLSLLFRPCSAFLFRLDFCRQPYTACSHCYQTNGEKLLTCPLKS